MRAWWMVWVLVLAGCAASGCATTIAPDTKLALQGPRAKISKAF